MIPILVAEVTLDDRYLVVAVLVRAYLHQRRELKGASKSLEIDGVSYGIWPSEARPLTPIETSLYSWVDAGVHPVAQQVALQAFAAFASTDLEFRERGYVPGQPGHGIMTFGQAQDTLAPMAPRLRSLSLLGKMAMFLAVPIDGPRRAVLEPLFAEVLEIRHGLYPVRPYQYLANLVSEKGRQHVGEDQVRALPHIPLLLSRWKDSPDEGIKAVTILLGRACTIYAWRWPIVVVGFLVLLRLLVG